MDRKRSMEATGTIAVCTLAKVLCVQVNEMHENRKGRTA
jgi:hypothetical protein